MALTFHIDCQIEAIVATTVVDQIDLEDIEEI